MMMSYGDLVRFIKAAGKDPVERNSLYETLRTFGDDDLPPADSGPGGRTDGVPQLTQLVGTGRV
jgi:hypothetical protein